ncbi:MAG: sugar-binding transcriptional regulator [Sporolactobacillus sp.]|jgi:deoxyribonucleoside regulator|nr:sugar-binding transcriptional regulator [Sporolactobacillus sp.]
MGKSKIKQAILAAKLYYEDQKSQQEIAKQLTLSRPTVSRLLKYAKDEGFVQIKIIDPLANQDRLEKIICEKYHLDETHVVYSPSSNYADIISQLGKFTADYLGETIKEGDMLGISWGMTMHHVAIHMHQQATRGVQVIQLKGSITYSSVNTYANETLTEIAHAFNTIPLYLPLPVIFDNQETKELVEKDRHINHIMAMGREANVALFTVGTVRNEALLFKLGYFNDGEKYYLQTHAVGDICSRFFNEQGEIASESINKRTVGIALNDLRSKERSILVAGGQQKTKAIKGALQGHYANILITDQMTANQLVD